MRPFYLLCCSALALFGAAQLSAQSLDAAVRMALESNPEAQAADFAKDAAKADVEDAKGELLPRANLTGGLGTSTRERAQSELNSGGDALFGTELRLTLRQQLYDGGGDRARLNSQQHLAAATKLQQGQTQETVALGAVEAYLGVLRAQALIQEAKSNISAHEDAADQARQRANVQGDEVGLTLVNGRLGLAQSVLESRQAQLKTAEVRFERYVGAKPVGLRPPPNPNLPISPQLIDTSRNFNYRAAQEAARAQGQEAKAIQAQWRPEVAFEANGAVGRDLQGIRGQANEANVLLVGKWDFYDQAANPAYLAAQQRWKEASELAVEAKLEADLEAQEAWATYLSASEQLAALEGYRDKIQQVLADYEQQFGAGKRSFLELLDTKNELSRARTALIEADFEEQISGYRLLAVMGQLRSNLSGEKPEPAPEVAEIETPALKEEVSTVASTFFQRLNRIRRIRQKTPESN